MAQVLSDREIAAFAEQGYVSPLRAITAAEAAGCRRQLEAYEAETGAAEKTLHMKAHLYLRWLWELSRHPRIVGALRDLLGPDLLVLASRFWIKEPHDGRYVSWHQDVTYFGLDPQRLVTVWLALTPVTATNGCMRVLPGTHRDGVREHVQTRDPANLLARGQRVEGLDEASAREVLLEPGELSLHDGLVLHSSEPNESSDRRIGFAWMVMPTSVRSSQGRRRATLLCGDDRHGHWEHDRIPEVDRDPALLAEMLATRKKYEG